MYRTVETGMWDDPKFRSLPPLGKLLFTFLFTNRVGHVSGIYPLPRVMMTYGTGIDGPTVDTLCDTLSRLGLAYFDPALDLVFVVSMLKHQGRGEKNERSAAAHLATLHNSFLVREFLNLYPSVSKYVPDTLLDRVSEVRSPARAEQKQEQELEQEKEKRGSAPASGAPPRSPRAPRFDPRTVPIPEELAGPEFATVWEARLRERSEPNASGGKPSESQIRAQLSKLAKLAKARGLPAAVACVERATEGRHQGIVFQEDFAEPRGRNGAQASPAVDRQLPVGATPDLVERMHALDELMGLARRNPN
jgi:hypothetical protein